MIKNARRLTSGRRTLLLMSVPLLGIVAGCKPGDTVDTVASSFLSPFNAPAPVDTSVLATFFENAMLPSVVTQTAALFATDARYRNQ